MLLVQWVARVVGATLWLAFHLAIVTGLYLLSAHLATQAPEDQRNVGLLVRGLASVWLYIAAWTWLVRGVFQRPARPADKGKPTGTEVARTSLGCLANLVPIPFLFVFAGRIADWAWAGIRGDDVGHPARVAADRLLAAAIAVLEHSGEWMPWAIGCVALVSAARSILAAIRRRENRRNPQAQRNGEAALQSLKSRRKQGSRATPRPGQRENLAAAGAASAATIRAAHAGAHGAEAPRFTPGSAREDRVLGVLTYSSSDGGWWAHREEGGFPVHIAGVPEGPDPRAMDLAHQAVQRNFEVLLRASDAARTVAQGRGVGLPRFTIAAIHVGAGTAPDVAVHLRCDADAGHEYRVKSVDKLQTFKAV